MGLDTARYLYDEADSIRHDDDDDDDDGQQFHVGKRHGMLWWNPFISFRAIYLLKLLRVRIVQCLKSILLAHQQGKRICHPKKEEA